jgi:hypothetical protein
LPQGECESPVRKNAATATPNNERNAPGSLPASNGGNLIR